MHDHKIAVLVNTASGARQAAETAAAIRKAFQNLNIEPKISLVHPGSDLSEAARSAAEQGCNVLAAAGGDGSVGAVAGVAADVGALLAVIPTGTLNHFAKDLGIPTDIPGAVNTIAAGKHMPIDAARVNGRLFVNNSSIGMYPKIIKHRERLQQLGSGKWFAFFVALAHALKAYPQLNVRLTADGREISCRTPFVFVGNNDYSIEGFGFGLRHSLNQHYLSVFTARDSHSLSLLRLGFHVLAGTARMSGDVISHRCSELYIEVPKKFIHASCDGEVATLETPLLYQSASNALRAIVP